MPSNKEHFISVYISDKKIKAKLKALGLLKVIVSPSKLINQLITKWIKDYEHENGTIKTIDELLGEKKDV